MSSREKGALTKDSVSLLPCFYFVEVLGCFLLLFLLLLTIRIFLRTVQLNGSDSGSSADVILCGDPPARKIL